MAQSGRAMEPVIPCQGGQKELSDIMLTMEKYFMLKTQTREKKSKVIFHELSMQQVRRLDGFEPDVGGRQRQGVLGLYHAVMQRFRVVYRKISHKFSLCTHEPFYQENTSDMWDIPKLREIIA